MSPSKNKGVKKKKKGVSKSTQAKKNRMGKKVEKITQQLQEVQNEVLQLEQQARVLCNSVVRCESKLFPYLDPENIQNMSLAEYEQAHSELQEMMFDCRQIMEKITLEKNNLLELIDSLGLNGEDKKELLKSLEGY